jgi:hypothetical protein
MGEALTCSTCRRKKTTRFYGSECCGCYAYRQRHGIKWSQPKCQRCDMPIVGFARISKQFCQKCTVIAAKASWASSTERSKRQEKRCPNCSSLYRGSYRLCGRCHNYQWRHGGDPRPITQSCMNCGRDFPFSRTKTVCSPTCKAEWRRTTKAVYYSDPEKMDQDRKCKREWAKRNPDKVHASQKKTREKYAKEYAALNREYSKRNREKINRYRAGWRARNPQAVRDAKRRNYWRHRERFLEKQNKYLDAKDPLRPLRRAIRVGYSLVGRDRITP